MSATLTKKFACCWNQDPHMTTEECWMPVTPEQDRMIGLLVSEIGINAARLYATRERHKWVNKRRATAVTATSQSIGSKFGQWVLTGLTFLAFLVEGRPKE